MWRMLIKIWVMCFSTFTIHGPLKQFNNPQVVAIALQKNVHEAIPEKREQDWRLHSIACSIWCGEKDKMNLWPFLFRCKSEEVSQPNTRLLALPPFPFYDSASIFPSFWLMHTHMWCAHMPTFSFKSCLLGRYF